MVSLTLVAANGSASVISNATAVGLLNSLVVAPVPGSAAGSATAACGTALVSLDPAIGSASWVTTFELVDVEDRWVAAALAKHEKIDALGRVWIGAEMSRADHLAAMGKRWAERNKTRIYHA